MTYFLKLSFPRSSIGKEFACNAGDLGLIPGLGRSPGEENVNPLPYSCLENPMDREAWKAIQSMGSQESDTTERLSTHLKLVDYGALFWQNISCNNYSMKHILGKADLRSKQNLCISIDLTLMN